MGDPMTMGVQYSGATTLAMPGLRHVEGLKLFPRKNPQRKVNYSKSCGRLEGGWNYV
ncbi:MAG: hypothetical protein NPIRA06_09440 [Nitrospirales bacterium]|nr:MAG: hypothetical protein NPIRA06_09440 [Nitrospirales bacterium]